MYTVLSLGELLDTPEYNPKKLEESFKKFSCVQEHDLENFLKNKAITYEKAGFGKTYLLINTELLKKGIFSIMAYFTIAQRAVDISEIPGKQRRKMLGNYPGRDNLKNISAYLIGQFGRSDHYTHDQLDGTTIMNECYNIISMAAKIIGGNLIVLECRECMFENFYEKEGFKKLYPELSSEKLYTLYKKFDFSIYWTEKLSLHTKPE